ncbi:MAG: hypothetical protein MI923_19230 [Phycisphaerales bacterium]|nr:hypothetical protein [Phycisphaerales bacterium]
MPICQFILVIPWGSDSLNIIPAMIRSCSRRRTDALWRPLGAIGRH